MTNNNTNTAKRTRLITALGLCAALLTGCGGSSTDSGTGGGSDVTPGPGTFRGVLDYEFKFKGNGLGRRVLPVLVTVNGTNIVVEDTELVYRGRLSGNRFDISVQAGNNPAGYACRGPARMTGTVGDVVSARLIVDYTCTKAGVANERLTINSPWVARR